MRNRTVLLIVGIIVVGLLAVGGTAGAMALTHSGFTGNDSGYGTMNGEPGDEGMMGSQDNQGNMMGGRATIGLSKTS